MLAFWIATAVLSFLGLLIFGVSYLSYRLTFRSAKPTAKEYVPDFIRASLQSYKDEMAAWSQLVREAPHREVAIRTFDGLTLRGYYYEYCPEAPVEILFHGYRSMGVRDMGGVSRCFALGHNALIVDQRGCGRSDGHVITFGIDESRDCRAWAYYVADKLAPHSKIILSGVSMGAATVMMCADRDLPDAVVGIIADCGYTSPEAIIKLVMEREYKLPVSLIYPLVRLGGLLFGDFDTNSNAPVRALKHSRLPVLFIHGEADGFIPSDMSVANYNACSTKKRLVTVPGAEHGLSFLADREAYIAAVKDFFAPLL